MLEFNSFSWQVPPLFSFLIFFFFPTWSPVQRLLVVLPVTCTSWVPREVHLLMSCTVTHHFHAELIYLLHRLLDPLSSSHTHEESGSTQAVQMHGHCENTDFFFQRGWRVRRWHCHSLRTNQALPTEFRAAYKKAWGPFSICISVQSHHTTFLAQKV